MGRCKGSGGVKEKRRKRVTVKLIPRVHAGEVTEPWALMEEIKLAHHSHLADARITLAWRLGWRADANGILCLGKCRKRGDLDRELDSFDFVIMLNQEAWQGLNIKEKRALIDHELCHAQIVIDSDGNPKLDDRDRLVCRIRKHDCEEFKIVVERHGVWTSDLAALAQAIINDAKRPLLAEAQKAETAEPGDNGESEPPAGEPSAKTSKAWRRWPTSCLVEHGLAAGKLKLLTNANLTTMGKLIDRMNKAGDEEYWWKEIKGFGESGYDNLVDAMVALRKAKPEFQEA